MEGVERYTHSTYDISPTAYRSLYRSIATVWTVGEAAAVKRLAVASIGSIHQRVTVTSPSKVHPTFCGTND